MTHSKRRIVGIFIGFVLLFTVAPAQDKPAATVSADDEMAVKEVIREFFDRFSKKDVPGIKALWSEWSPNTVSVMKGFESTFAQFEAIEIKSVSYKSSVLKTGSTIARFTADLNAISKKTHVAASVLDSPNRVFSLTKQQDTWKIVQQDSAETYLADLLAQAKTGDERRSLLDENKDLISDLFARAVNSRAGKALFQENDNSLAIILSDLALTISQENGNIYNQGAALNILGIAFGRRSDFQKSTDYFMRSLDVVRPLNNPNLESIVWNGLALNYSQQGDYDNAIKAVKKRVEYTEKIGDKAGLVNALNNISTFYKDTGDFARALDAQTRALSILEELGKDDPEILKSSMASALQANAGLLYKTLGDDAQALAYYERAQKINDETGQVNAGLWINIGNLYLNKGDYELAREYFEKALKISESRGAKSPMSGANSSIGNVYRDLGDYKKALEYHTKALQIRKDAGIVNGLDGDRLSIAYDQFLLGDHQSALVAVERMAPLRKQDDQDVDSPSANTLAGRIYAIKGDYDKSRLYFEAAIHTIEKIRQRFKGNEVSMQLFNIGMLSPYQEMVKLQVGQNRPVDAIAYAEKAKARTMLNVLQDGKINVRKAMTPAELEAERNFRVRLVSLESQVSGEIRGVEFRRGQISGLEEQLKTARLEFEDFRNRLYVSHPELKVQRGEMKSISLDEAGLLLPDAKSASIEFVVADDKAFAFVITKDLAKKALLKAYPIDIKQKDLTARVEKYRAKLAAGDLDFQKQSRELYDLLLKPAQAQLAGKTNLIIVPDGPLWDLPFQALQDGKGKYLVEQAAVSYAPSLTALREMSKKAKSRKLSGDTELLAFGNPIVGKETKDRVQRVFMSEKLEPLPESERLVNELGKMYGPKRSKIFTGAAAREETAKAESPKFRIVQFATHGILNNVSPMYSHLVLAQNDKNPNEDGLLEAWEMKDLDLRADMVILSACETARGKVSNGEGMIGMTWASFIAGAPTTVASQWKVESSSTSELMLEFHRGLLSESRISKAEALRRASLKLMKMPKYKHPSYWAGFVLVGDGS